MKIRNAPLEHMSPSNKRLGQISLWGLILYSAYVSYCALVPLHHWHFPAHDIFHGLWYGWRDKIVLFDIIQNLLLYLPLGFFAVFAISKNKFSPFKALSFGTLLALLICTSLEFLQSFNPARVPSALDILLNTLSGSLGALIAIVFFHRWISLFYYTRDEIMYPITLKSPLPLLGVMMLGAWWFYQWYPVLPTLHPTHIEQGMAPFFATLYDLNRLDLPKIMTYFSQVFILYSVSLVSFQKWHFWILLGFLILILPFKILIIGRVLSLEAVLGSVAGLVIAALLHRLLLFVHKHVLD